MAEKRTKNPAKWRQPWSEEDLCRLRDLYGLIPNKVLAQRLQRSEISMLAIARGKLHIKETDNFYTASELARTLGIGTIDTIARWVRKGWLKSSLNHHPSREKSPWSHHSFHDRRFQVFDPHRRIRDPSYRFTEEDVTKCLRQRPWLVATKTRVCRAILWRDPEYGIFLLPDDRSAVLNLKSMESSHFRSVVRDEWERDPWYTTTQAASLLQVCVTTIGKYINRGWLSAYGHEPDGKVNVYIIRHSRIEAFLANDPRPSHLYNARSKANKLRLRKEGRPTRIGVVWNIECPGCGREVKIMAPPDMYGPQVKERFIAIYVNGTCFHSASVDLTITPQRV